MQHFASCLCLYTRKWDFKSVEWACRGLHTATTWNNKSDLQLPKETWLKLLKKCPKRKERIIYDCKTVQVDWVCRNPRTSTGTNVEKHQSQQQFLHRKKKRKQEFLPELTPQSCRSRDFKVGQIKRNSSVFYFLPGFKPKNWGTCAEIYQKWRGALCRQMTWRTLLLKRIGLTLWRDQTASFANHCKSSPRIWQRFIHICQTWFRKYFLRCDWKSGDLCLQYQCTNEGQTFDKLRSWNCHASVRKYTRRLCLDFHSWVCRVLTFWAFFRMTLVPFLQIEHFRCDDFWQIGIGRMFWVASKGSFAWVFTSWIVHATGCVVSLLIFTSLPLKKGRRSIEADRDSGSTRPMLKPPSWMPPPCRPSTKWGPKSNPPGMCHPTMESATRHDVWCATPHDAPPPLIYVPSPIESATPLLVVVYGDGWWQRSTLAFGAKFLVLPFGLARRINVHQARVIKLFLFRRQVQGTAAFGELAIKSNVKCADNVFMSHKVFLQVELPQAHI